MSFDCDRGGDLWRLYPSVNHKQIKTTKHIIVYKSYLSKHKNLKTVILECCLKALLVVIIAFSQSVVPKSR
jgi:hypothetical protein